jgi:hypothetical protein
MKLTYFWAEHEGVSYIGIHKENPKNYPFYNTRLTFFLFGCYLNAWFNFKYLPNFYWSRGKPNLLG